MLKSRLMFVWLCTGYLLLVFKLSFAAEPSPKPILRIEPQTHFAPIWRIDVDAAERFVVTAADDKTARVWDAQTGKLLQTLRPPIAEGNEGKLFAIAISPDAEWIAVAGWTGAWDQTTSIYIFQRSTGQLSARIRNLPNVIFHLAFSANGQHLAVALAAGEGIRLYTRPTWQALAQDSDYGADSYSVDFARDGRILSTSLDGYLRLYDGQLKLLQRYQTQAGKQPFQARFSPDGKQIVVGFADSTALELLTADDLKPLRMIQEPALDNGDLMSVAWSQDGKRFYAGGRYVNDQGMPLLVWPATQATQPEAWPLAQGTVMDIKPLRDGGVLVGTTDPTLMRLDAQGGKRWQQGAGVLIFNGREDHNNLAVSADAKMMSLHYAKSTASGVAHAQQIWSVETLSLLAASPTSLTTARHTAKGLQIENWQGGSTSPRLNGQPLPLEANEVAYSLAIDAQGHSFVMGTGWSLGLLNASGRLIWQQAVPNAWAVNLSADNAWVLAALGDGTVRWYEKASGKERLAFYLHPDEKRWVAWTPEGFYAVSGADAESLIGYHLNQGADRAAKWVGVEQLRQVFARADLVSKALDADYAALAAQALEKAGSIEAILAKGLPPILQVVGDLSYQLKQRDFTLKLRAQDQGGGLGRVEYRINGALLGEAQAKPFGARLPTGQQTPLQANLEQVLERSFTLNQGENTISATIYNQDNQIASESVTVKVQVDDPVQREPSLYVLSIGVAQYRDTSLALKYAAQDATLFAEQWTDKQGKLFKAVTTKVLPDQAASLAGIKAAFEELASKVQPQDVFVLYLAGHGMTENGSYYFVPQDAVYENKDSFLKQALGEEQLRDLIAKIQARKRLMVLDTCYAGKTVATLAQADLPQARSLENKAAIDRLMQATGNSVIAAASSQQEAYEGIVEGNKGHGLLTYTLLQGLKGEANTKADDSITVEELQAYAREQVPKLSKKYWSYEQFPMMQLNGSDFPVMELRQ